MSRAHLVLGCCSKAPAGTRHSTTYSTQNDAQVGAEKLLRTTRARQVIQNTPTKLLTGKMNPEEVKRHGEAIQRNEETIDAVASLRMQCRPRSEEERTRLREQHFAWKSN